MRISPLERREFHREILLVAEPARLAVVIITSGNSFASCTAASREQTRVVTTLISLLDFASTGESSRVESRRIASGCRASRRILTAANSAKSLGTNSLSAAQHRRWNPRRNFRFRRGSRALAEPKDDRSASEIVRDNSPPCGFLSLSLSLSCYFTLPFPYLLLLPLFLYVQGLSLCFSFHSRASDTSASLLWND